VATGNRSILQLEYADSAPTKWTYAAHADLPMGEIKRTFHCAGRDGRMAANHEPVRAMFPSLFYSPQQVARKRSRVTDAGTDAADGRANADGRVEVLDAPSEAGGKCNNTLHLQRRKESQSLYVKRQWVGKPMDHKGSSMMESSPAGSRASASSDPSARTSLTPRARACRLW